MIRYCLKTVIYQLCVNLVVPVVALWTPGSRIDFVLEGPPTRLFSGSRAFAISASNLFAFPPSQRPPVPLQFQALQYQPPRPNPYAAQTSQSNGHSGQAQYGNAQAEAASGQYGQAPGGYGGGVQSPSQYGGPYGGQQAPIGRPSTSYAAPAPQAPSSSGQYGGQNSGRHNGQQVSFSGQHGSRNNVAAGGYAAVQTTPGYAAAGPSLSDTLSNCFWKYKTTKLIWANPYERRPNVTADDCAQSCIDAVSAETFPCKSFVYEDKFNLCDLFAVTGMDPQARVSPAIHSTYFEYNSGGCNGEAGSTVSPGGSTSAPAADACPAGQLAVMVRARGNELVGSDGLVTDDVSELDCVQACRTNTAPDGSNYPCLSIDYNFATQTCIQTTEAAIPTRNGVFNLNPDVNYYEKLCVPDTSASSCAGGVLERYPEMILLGFDQKVNTATDLGHCIDLCLTAGDTCQSVTFLFDPNLPTDNCLLNVENELTEPNLLVAQQGQLVEFVSLSACDTGVIAILTSKSQTTRNRQRKVPDKVRRRFVSVEDETEVKKRTRKPKLSLKERFRKTVRPSQGRSKSSSPPVNFKDFLTFNKFLSSNKLRRTLIPKEIVNTIIPKSAIRVTSAEDTFKNRKRLPSKRVFSFSRDAFTPVHRLTLATEHDPTRSYREQLLVKFGANQ